MVRHLVLDAVRRGCRNVGLLLVVTTVPWIGITQGYLPVSLGVMVSLMMSYALGPVGSIPMLGLRELRTLPTTSRDLWVSSWILSIIAIPLALTSIRNLIVISVIALGGTSVLPVETLLLMLIYDIAYASALMPIGPAFGYASNRAATRQPRWLWVGVAIACFLLFMGGFVLPWAFYEAIPLTFDQFTPPWVAGLAACFVMTVVSFKWTPHRGGFSPARVAGTAAAPIATAPQREFWGRFTGIGRIAWPHAANVFVLSVVAIGCFIGYWALFVTGEDLRSFLSQNLLLPFEAAFQLDPDSAVKILLPTYIALSGSGFWAPWARQLRVLPLNVYQIDFLVLFTPFATWAIVWTVLLLTHFFVLGTWPVSLRPAAYLAVSGISALMTAGGLRGRGPLGMNIWMIAAFGFMFSMTQRFLTRGAAGFPAVFLAGLGLAALVIAAVVLHRTLTRSTSSSRIYRQTSAPFGVTAPGERP
jgi:hypothetical protein